MTLPVEQGYDRHKQILMAVEAVRLLMEDVPVKIAKIRTKQRCPICGEPFIEIPNNGLICIQHKTVPKKLFVDVYWKGERVKVYSNKSGQVLSSYDLARDVQGQIETEIKNKTFDPEKYRKQNQALFLCPTLLDKFLKDREKRTSLSTHYSRYVVVLKEHLHDKDIREIRKLDLINLKEELEEKYVAPGEWKAKTLKNYMDAMQAFMNYCKADLELIPVVPAFPAIEVDEPPPHWVHSDDQLQLFSSVRDEDKPLIGFLMLHGCRPGEARALKCKDIDLDADTCTIHATFSAGQYSERRKGKKSKPFMVPIHPEARGYLEERKREALPEAWVFPNPRTGGAYTEAALRRVWNRVRSALKVHGIRLYDASRHSYASQLVNQNVSLYTVSKLLGHSNIKTTEKYAHADMKHLRVEINKVTLKVVPAEFVPKASPQGKSDKKE